MGRPTYEESVSADADLAPVAHNASVGGELLDALIVEICDQQIAIRGDGDANGGIELTGTAARPTDQPPGSALLVEDLEAVVEILGDVTTASGASNDCQVGNTPSSGTAGRSTLRTDPARFLQGRHAP